MQPLSNQVLQRTAPCVTRACTVTFPPAVQVPRGTSRSLSLGSLGLMKGLLIASLLAATSPLVAEDPVTLLRTELAGLNLAQPEADAERDIAKGESYCFSVNGYARDFPGVTEKDWAFCQAKL